MTQQATTDMLLTVDRYKDDPNLLRVAISTPDSDQGAFINIPADTLRQLIDDEQADLIRCPECMAGKHGNCDGTAWDDVEDCPTKCECDCQRSPDVPGSAGARGAAATATIWRFNLPVADTLTVQVPAGGEILPHVWTDSGIVSIWAIVDPDAPLVPRRFHIRGTGHPLGVVGRYVGTAVADSGLVWHVFEGGV